ncbi:MAG: peptidoglycan-binding protein [Hormoscilla sp.]
MDKAASCFRQQSQRSRQSYKSSGRSIWLLVSCITCLGVVSGPAKSFARVPSPAILVAQTQSQDKDIDPFEQGKKLAKQAVEDGETAYRPQDWESIAVSWARAQALMEQVPASDSRYAEAQARVELYGQNSQIAAEEVEKSRRRSQLPPFESLLRPGTTGMLVSQLQYALKVLGYFQGKIDGVYADSTSEAVSAFQASRELTADGLAGETTWEALQTARAARPTERRTTPTAKPTVESPKKEPEAKDEGVWLKWVLIGLVASIVTAGLVLLLLKLRNQDLEVAEETSVETEIESETARPEPASADAIEDRKLTATAEKSEQPGQLAKIDIIDELIAELTTPDQNQRRKAIWELGQLGTSQASQPLVNLLLDADSQERSLILAALAEIGVRTFKPMNRALAISLQDNNPEVRKNAIRDLTRMYELIANVNQMVRYAVDDPDLEVRETAQWAMNQLSRIRANLDDDLPNGKES